MTREADYPYDNKPDKSSIENEYKAFDQLAKLAELQDRSLNFIDTIKDKLKPVIVKSAHNADGCAPEEIVEQSLLTEKIENSIDRQIEINNELEQLLGDINF